MHGICAQLTGGTLAKEGLSAKFELILGSTLASQRSFLQKTNERMLTLCLSTEQGTVNILCIYTPTMSASPKTKDKFYDDLNTAVKNIPLNEFLLLLRDF